MIGVINYHGGNAPSVVAALERIDAPHHVVETTADFADLAAVILPGVGAAAATLDSLQDQDLIAPLTDFVRGRGMPFLGICVGLQVLFEHSEEGDRECLGWVKGTVHRFDDARVRVPQIGWNILNVKQIDHPLLHGLQNESYCYFVNSYHARPQDPATILAETDYEGPSTAIIAQDNIWATQFHTEKSGPVGLRMLSNFVNTALVDSRPLAAVEA